MIVAYEPAGLSYWARPVKVWPVIVYVRIGGAYLWEYRTDRQ